MGRRVPRQRPPTGLQRRYARELLKIVAEMRVELTALLVELPDLLRSAAVGKVAKAGEARRIRQLVERASERLGRSLTPHRLELLAQQIAAGTSDWNDKQLRRQFKAIMGADPFFIDPALGAIVDDFVVDNVALIKSLPIKTYEEIERASVRAVRQGTPHRQLAKEINRRFALGRNRARLIARDQVLKLYGQINGQRQKDLGVKEYVWRTVNDERVRDEHADREGLTFRWDDPPADGHPGDAVQCRCFAEPRIQALEKRFRPDWRARVDRYESILRRNAEGLSTEQVELMVDRYRDRLIKPAQAAA